MHIELDKTQSRSLYRQIRDQIRRMVDEGTLKAGTRLPGTRELADQLGVSRKTVLTAYTELEAEAYIETRPQSGTYVRNRGTLATHGVGASSQPEVPNGVALMDWSPYAVPGDFFAMPPRERRNGDDAPVSFTKALPDDRLFPFEQIKQITSTLLWYPKEFFFNYGNPQGYQPLVEYIEQQMALEGVVMKEGAPGTNHVIITNGFQNALNLLTGMLIRNGETVVVENPTYAGILNLLIGKRIKYVGVPVDENGMMVSKLAAILKEERVGMIVTIPTYHNPTGTTMSLERRHALLKLAEQYSVPVIEDAHANRLRYGGEVMPTLKALDRGGHVIQVGSFSKTLLPGLRLGWMTLPEDAAVHAFHLKRACDKSDSFFLQVILHEFIKKGHFENHIKRTARIYRARRDAMLAAMERHFPDCVSWNAPDGGLSLWVKLPPRWKSLPVFVMARERGVEFAVANFFWSGKEDANGFRLSFSQVDESEIEKGIERLGSVLNDIAARPAVLNGAYGRDGEL
ncbi:MAG: PLP-dependent aminotransferase family protein [bacterium]|jgi:GntR family transcriptional regulator/MocR family aminotransferase